MAKFMVKRSELKNVCKAVNDRKLAELKKEIIEILKKQDEKDFKKATDYLNSQEEHFTHLEKSLSGKWIEKAGYGIGTVRVWKGKKYKKIAPNKWVRVFDKEGRGTNIAIGKLIAKVNKIDNVEDLMAFVMANKQRFVDENGMDLPVLDKLRAAVGVKNENLSGESSSYTYGVGENVSREKNKLFESKDKITKEEADLHKVARKFSQMPTTELKQRKAKLERWIENKTRNKRDSLNNAIFRESYQKELDAINEVLDKRNTKKEDKPDDNRESRMNGLKDEIEFYAGVADENGKLSKEQVKGLKEALENLYVFGNRVVNNDFLRGVKALEENGGKFSDEEISKKDKETEEVDPRTGKENYWIQDPYGDRLTNEDAKNWIKENYSKIEEIKNSDVPRKDMQIRKLKYEILDLKDRLNPDDRKEIESEYEKTQKRSEAMKGNQNAKKYGLTDDQIERYDIQEVVEDVNGYGIVKNSEGKYSYIDNGRVKDRPDDFETSIEKVKERINDTYETKKNVEAAKNFDFKNAKLGSDIEYSKRSDGRHMYFKKSPDGSKAISVTVEVSDMREPLNMTYEVSDTKSGESWQYETAYGNKEGLEWAVERPEQMEKELKKFFKRDPNKEWDKMNSDIKPQNDVYAPSESTNLETKKAIAENKNIGENEVQMPYSKELAAEMETLKDCVSRDRDRQWMQHVYYNDGNLIATDGRRMKLVKVGELNGIENGSYVDIDISKNGINLKKREGMEDKKYPNYSRVIPDDLSQKVILKNNVIKEKIKDMKKDGAIDKKVGRVQLEFKDGKVYLDDTEIGEAQNINLKYSDDWGPARNETNLINVNADYLVNALNGDSSILMLGERSDKAMGISTDSTVNILMPMNGTNEKIDYSEGRKAKKARDDFESEEKKKHQDAMNSIVDTQKESMSDAWVQSLINRVNNKEMDNHKAIVEHSYNALKEAEKMIDKPTKKWTSSLTNNKYGFSLLAATRKNPEFKTALENMANEYGLIKKSLFDDFVIDNFIEEDIDDIEEEKEEESLWNDYSAEQPELFNSVELQVCEAMNRHYSNCL